MGALTLDGEIGTERLRLRPLEAGEAARISALGGALAVSGWLAGPPVRRAWRTGSLPASARGAAAPGPSSGRDTPGAIGVIGLDGPHEKQSLGHWLGTPLWGCGYADEAARAVVERAFRTGAGAPASGACDGNAASLRVREKLGRGAVGQRMLRCEATDRDLLHIDTRLSRAGWEARA